MVSNPPPKNRTKSRSGCITCKKRRLKCDETKPTCLECARRKVECGGYAKNFKWRSFEETNVCARINKQNSTATTTKPRTGSVSKEQPAPRKNSNSHSNNNNNHNNNNGSNKTDKSIDSLIHAAAEMVTGNGQDQNDGEAHATSKETSATSKPPPPSTTDAPAKLEVTGKSTGNKSPKKPPSTVATPSPPASENGNNYHHYQHESITLPNDPDDSTVRPLTPRFLDGVPSPDLKGLVSTMLPNDFSKWNNGEAPSPTFSAILGSMTDDNFMMALPSPKDLDLLDMRTPQNDEIKVEELDSSNDRDSQSSPVSSWGGSSSSMVTTQQTQYGWGDAYNDKLQGWLANFFESQQNKGGIASPFSFNLGSVPTPLVDSHEKTFKLYDRYTCGILSIKDGPNENPWRTVLWPLAQKHGALYHAVAAMTKFHTARSDPELRSQAMHHMKESFHLLAEGLSNKTLPPDIALATTLSLAFAEAWDRHITTGIAHLRGAAAMLKELLRQHRNEPLPPWLQFLFNSWLYLDVCARLGSDSGDESSIFELTDDDDDSYNSATQMLLNNDVFEESSSDESHPSPKNRRASSTSSNSRFELRDNLFAGQRDEVDPLLGCAQTLFPLIGKVGSLVQKVRKSSKNSLSMVSEAVELKHQLETWNASLSKNMTLVEDPTWDLNSCLATAESYRYASLLYLHQAVPEVPSLGSHELAEKVMMLLASIPSSSRTAVVHIFPLLIAGCEANGDERTWVSNRWRTLSDRMWIGNVDRTIEVVKEVWLRKDMCRQERSRQQQQQQQAHNEPAADSKSNNLSARRSSRDIATSIASRVSEAFGGARPQEDPEDEGIKGWCHWSVVMKEWGWEVLLG